MFCYLAALVKHAVIHRLLLSQPYVMFYFTIIIIKTRTRKNTNTKTNKKGVLTEIILTHFMCSDAFFHIYLLPTLSLKCLCLWIVFFPFVLSVLLNEHFMFSNQFLDCIYTWNAWSFEPYDCFHIDKDLTTPQTTKLWIVDYCLVLILQRPWIIPTAVSLQFV